jgi:integrase
LQASVLQARADGTNSKNDAILRKSDLLSSVVDAWVKDKLQLGEWTEHTRRDNEPMIREFVEMVEDKPIGLLAAEHLRDARERFLRIPKNRKQTRKYDGMTLRELSEMEIPEAARLSKQTLHNRAVKIGGFLKWARDRGYPVADGLEKVMAFKKERRKASEYKSVFTPDDLTKIFNPELYLKEAKGQSARFWVPLIGLCTGMRIEEICQLELDDIHTVPSRVYPELPGVLCFDVNEEGEKHVKSGASERKVPMSPVLEELGFLEYVEKLRRDKQTRLFPELGKNESGGKYSATVSKWFGRYLDKVGIQDDPKLGKKTFHSFRHTFVTLCYDFRVSGRDIKHVVGHAEKFDITSDQYGKVGDVAVLYKEVMVKAVPIVDLKPLKDALKDNPIW